MKIIRCLNEQIEDELKDADKYIELAMKWKDDEPEAAELFAELSEEEMGHAGKLHENVVERIKEYRDKHGEPPEVMMELYEYMHRKHKETSMAIKVKQGMYRA